MFKIIQLSRYKILLIMAGFLLIACYFIINSDEVKAIPATFNLQGRVTDKSGNLVANGFYPMTFRIYTNFYGGSPIWSEEWGYATSLVEIKDGIFSVTLGTFKSLADIDFSTGNYYLSVEFNSDGEMSPRKKLSSVPFSLFSSNLQNKTSSDFVEKRGDTMLGNLNLDKHNLTTTGQVVAGEFLQGATKLSDIYLKLIGGTLTGSLSVKGVTGLTDTDIPDTITASNYLPLSGGTLSGSLAVSGVTGLTDADIPNNLTASNYLPLSGGTLSGSLAVSGVTGLTDADIPDAITASNYLPLSGGTLTGSLTGTSSRFDSGIGILTAAVDNKGINIVKQNDVPGQQFYGLYNTLTDLQGRDYPGTVYGVYNNLLSNGILGSGTSYGVYTLGNTNTSNTQVYGYYYKSNTQSNTGTQYAFYSDFSGGTNVTKWNLYLQNAKSFLGSDLRIGGTAPSSPSDVLGVLDLRTSAGGSQTLIYGLASSGDIMNIVGLFRINNVGYITKGGPAPPAHLETVDAALATSTANVGAVNRINIVPIYFSTTFGINTISVRVGIANANIVHEFGFYDSSGALVGHSCSWGLPNSDRIYNIDIYLASDINCSIIYFFAHVTFEPGTYYFAWTSSSTTATLSTATLPQAGMELGVGYINDIGGTTLPSSIVPDSIIDSTNKFWMRLDEFSGGLVN